MKRIRRGLCLVGATIAIILITGGTNAWAGGSGGPADYPSSFNWALLLWFVPLLIVVYGLIEVIHEGAHPSFRRRYILVIAVLALLVIGGVYTVGQLGAGGWSHPAYTPTQACGGLVKNSTNYEDCVYGYYHGYYHIPAPTGPVG